MCVIEVKRGTESLATSTEQIERYMTRASQHSHRAQDMHGFLIMGNTVGIYKLTTEGSNVGTPGVVGLGYTDLFDDRVIKRLAQMSRRYWNH